MKQIKVNLQEPDYKKLSDMAINQGVSMAELIRRQFDFNNDNISTKKIHQKIDPALLFELHQLTTSLNNFAENMSQNIEVNSLILYEIHRRAMRLI